MQVKALLFSLGLLLCSSLSAQTKQITVVIDPGHGGSDPGHLSNNDALLPEKTLNLKISTFLGTYIEKYLQNVKVVYTRTGDSFPSLDARVEKANNSNADYFISIHCNGNERKAVRGTETHVHSMELGESVAFAKAIEKQFSSRAGRKSRGVKDQNDLQHSLQVLKFTNMPSVLVECGFVTNAREARYLNSTYGQEIIASAVFRAFRERIEKKYPGVVFRKSADVTTDDSDSTSETTDTHYGIQIASSKRPIDPSKDPSMRKAGMDVERRELNTNSAYKYIYLVGDYTSLEDANAALTGIREKGFGDAIVIKR